MDLTSTAFMHACMHIFAFHAPNTQALTRSHLSSRRHLTSFIISSRNVHANPQPSSPSVSMPGSGSGGSGGNSAGVILAKDTVFAFPGRSRKPNGRFSGFVEVVFLLGLRRQATGAQKLAVSLDGSVPKCQEQNFLTSVSIIHL
jgi:hypothetical protein